MPSSIFFDGQRRFRPSVYARVINNLQSRQAPATGNIALVGDFPQFKQATPALFTNSLDLDDFLRGTNSEITTAASLMFKPLEGDGTIDSLTIVNAGESTQASADFGGVIVKSRLYGPDGNRLKALINANVGDSSLYDLSVIEGSVVRETVEALGEGAIASVQYTGAGVNETLDRMTLEVTSSALNIDAGVSFLEAAVQAAGNLLTGTTPCNSQVTFQILSDQVEATTLNIAGLNAAGEVSSAAITIPADAVANDEFITVNPFSKITSITAPAGNNFTGVLRVDFNLFSSALATMTSLEDALDEFKALDDELSGNITVSAPAALTAGADIDRISSASILGASVSFTSDRQSIVSWFNGSAFVEAETTTNEAVTTNAIAQRLNGGSRDNTLSGDDWQAAFDSIKRRDINIVVPFSPLLLQAQAAAQHAVDAAQDAGYERNVWVGTSPNQTINQAYTGWSKELNDRNVAVTPQSIVVGGETLDPRYTACLLAGIQGATSISEPMTRKRPTSVVTGTVENFDREEDASLAIRRGLVIFADPSSTGIRVERSVTTWLKDDNPIYSEVSANESANQSIRLLREALQSQIGTKIVEGKRQAVQQAAEKALVIQKQNGIIRDFRDLTVVLDGDVANVVYSLATVEPLNFITVTANIVR